MERKQVIDLVRSLSVLLVCGTHLGFYHGFKIQNYFYPRLFFADGRYGVTLFFVVSGYLISGLLTSGRTSNYQIHFKNFYSRRVARILPLFLLIVLFALLMFGFGHEKSPLILPIYRDFNLQYGFWFWASLPTFLFNWFEVFNSNNYGIQWMIFWSLAVEEQFYLSYPWILKTIKKNRHIILFLIGIILSGLTYRTTIALLDLNDYRRTVVCSFGSFDQIAIGALLYFLSERWKNILDRKINSVCFCVAGFLVMAATYFNFHTSFPGYGVVFGPSLIAFGCFLFLMGGLRLSFFESKGLRWLAFPGKLSYGCYLLHPTILYFMSPWLVKLEFFTSLTLFMGVTILAAYISYTFFEQPSNRWIRKKLGTSGSPAPITLVG